MSQVTTLLKVMPNDDTVDTDELLEEIESEAVAFGIEALKILVSVSDEDGTEEVEETITEVEGVNTVEVESVNRE